MSIELPVTVEDQLRNLAAKQGATEGLLTKPEERLEQEPDWVKQAKGESALPPVQQIPAQPDESRMAREVPRG